jgi:hypothetical protein
MKKWFVLALAFCIPFLTSCTNEAIMDPGESQAAQAAQLAADPEGVARAILDQTGWPCEGDEAIGGIALSSADGVLFMGRQVLTGDIVEYSFQVPVGSGAYDVIGLHRVVRESAPNRPIRSRESIFLLHGDWKNFEGCFVPGLHSSSIPIEAGFAVYLAQHDVDVWGIDQAWALVPEGVGDFSFMADWGMQKHIDWTNTAVETARVLRRATGNGYRKMMLCGYSGGSALGFAVINQDAGVPAGRRKVSAYIGVEQGVRTDDPGWGQAMCDFAGTYQALIDAGQYQDNIIFPSFGIPARVNPDGASESMPGLTNYQAALALGAWAIFVPGFPTHLVAGVFDDQGVPTGLQYTNPDHWIDFLCFAPAYEAAAFERDEYIWCCPSAGDAPWDDNFSRVRIPIYYVAVGGGFGPRALQTLDLLGSSDKSSLLISLNPANPDLDFGHVDTFLGANATGLAWQPMLDWIEGHSE